MSSPCNNLNVQTIKISTLTGIKGRDLPTGNGNKIAVKDTFLLIQNGDNTSASKQYSRQVTMTDFVKFLATVPTGSYSGSFSGSYWGRIVSKNAKATGSFSGSHWGSVVSKNTKATGSFYGTTKTSGSVSGSFYGSVTSKNTKATGSFSGTNNKLSGSFSGSFNGSIVSKNAKITGSFTGTSKSSGSFSGSVYGSLTSKNTKATGSFRGVDYITNFNGTGKKVSYNGTSSYAVSASYATSASYAKYAQNADRVPVFAASNNGSLTLTTAATYTISFNLPAGYTSWDEYSFTCIAHADSGGLGGGIVQATLQYGGASPTPGPFSTSSTDGAGDYNRTYNINNSDDVTTATWLQIGMVTGANKTAPTLQFSATVTANGGTNPVKVRSVDLIGKAYAKK